MSGYLVDHCAICVTRHVVGSQSFVVPIDSSIQIEKAEEYAKDYKTPEEAGQAKWRGACAAICVRVNYFLLQFENSRCCYLPSLLSVARYK